MYLRATFRDRVPWYFELMARAFSRKRRDRSYSITPWSTRPILLYVKDKGSQWDIGTVPLASTLVTTGIQFSLIDNSGFTSTNEGQNIRFTSLQIKGWPQVKHYIKIKVLGLHRAGPFQDGPPHTPRAWGSERGTAASGQWTAGRWQSSTKLSASVENKHETYRDWFEVHLLLSFEFVVEHLYSFWRKSEWFLPVSDLIIC